MLFRSEIDLDVNGGVAPFDYSWSNGATSEDLAGLGGGTYTVTVTDDNGCIASTMFIVNEPSQVTISGSITNVSTYGGSDGAINITAAGGTGPYSYLWEDFSTDEDRSGIVAGTYTVTVTDNNSCSVSASFTVTQPQNPLSLSETHTDVTCFGFDNGSIDITVSGGISPFSYLWNDGNTNEDRTGLSGGTYTITVTDFVSSTATISVTINENAELQLSSSITDIQCNGDGDGEIDITVTGGGLPYSFLWSNGSTNEDLTGLSGGTYSVTVTDNAGCVTSGTYNVFEPTLISISESHTNPTCNGGSNGTIDKIGRAHV